MFFAFFFQQCRRTFHVKVQNTRRNSPFRSGSFEKMDQGVAGYFSVICTISKDARTHCFWLLKPKGMRTRILLGGWIIIFFNENFVLFFFVRLETFSFKSNKKKCWHERVFHNSCFKKLAKKNNAYKLYVFYKL